ncbi:cyclin-like protein [Bisporella sp. PMI_857]|nr:cyclin-like protein [Bisporella sp. PMI_857]
MSEDERYRTSTQFRAWSFTPASLLAQRIQTNENAALRVRAAVQRIREARARSTDSHDAEKEAANVTIPDGEIDCLTVEEELKLVTFYCRQALELGDFLKVATDVKATAVQYIKRFYISNSVMTYNPADVLKTALFFSTKTENHYISIADFAKRLPNTKEADVLALEFLLTQGLRFMFDVRHPFRALEGAVMEMLAVAKREFPFLPGGARPAAKPDRLEQRVMEAHGKAREYLKISALLTDVYFHFTPSQIMMASLLIVDSKLLEWYIDSKLPSTMDQGSMRMKVLSTIGQCADLLKSVNPFRSKDEADLERKHIKPLGKKLNKCRNPEKMDIQGLQRAKREGEDGLDEKVIKKRKLEREQSAKEGEDLFGPKLK